MHIEAVLIAGKLIRNALILREHTNFTYKARFQSCFRLVSLIVCLCISMRHNKDTNTISMQKVFLLIGSKTNGKCGGATSISGMVISPVAMTNAIFDINKKNSMKIFGVHEPHIEGIHENQSNLDGIWMWMLFWKSRKILRSQLTKMIQFSRCKKKCILRRAKSRCLLMLKTKVDEEEKSHINLCLTKAAWKTFEEEKNNNNSGIKSCFIRIE